MPSRRLPLAALTLSLALAVPANAATLHTVQSGQTLWSIAAANGVSPAELAAANGLSPQTKVITGTNLRIPTETEETGGAPAGSAPAPLGAYTVAPGDTLTAIAARAGVPVSEIAWMNGLDTARPLLAGTALKLPTGASTASSAGAPVRFPNAAPYATPVRATASQIGSIAQESGVPASLAQAIAWQESGFNNGEISPANARGVMQVMPGTWDWINNNLASSPLDPASMSDNIKAGVLYLGNLLRQTGGSIPAAVAGYYQGLGSVRQVGMLPDTRRYVNDVLSLTGQFGG